MVTLLFLRRGSTQNKPSVTNLKLFSVRFFRPCVLAVDICCHDNITYSTRYLTIRNGAAAFTGIESRDPQF